MARREPKASFPVSSSESSRDVYGFAVQPQHLQRYKEYAVIYKEEEAERSAKWERFLTTYGECALSSEKDVSADPEAGTGQTINGDNRVNESTIKFETWRKVRPSLWPVEQALRSRFKKSSHLSASSNHAVAAVPSTSRVVEPFRVTSPSKYATEGSEDESDEEFYDVERSDVAQDGAHSSPDMSNSAEHDEGEPCPWKEELDALVRGGVPMAMRGELWQVFVGTRTRRVQGHYQALVTSLAGGRGDSDAIGGSGSFDSWIGQIEKDLPRTFPGHPALDKDGRNALRRLLTAYAHHNPRVGYCQAMNFFAALLLLMMPEENAFWTLAGIIGDYFEGYYSEKMLESQVDQLVFEDLVRKHFPRIVTHLDTVGVKVDWVTGPWFLSIFVNVLPWESVLRVWDVLLYEGDCSMLFRTALALIELHGAAILATKDAGDVVATLQSLAAATFDSSYLVMVSCMGYQSVDESNLKELRLKNRPQVLAALSERSKELITWRSSVDRSFPTTLFKYDKGGSIMLGQQSGKALTRTVSGISVAGEDAGVVFYNDAFLDNGKVSVNSTHKSGLVLLKDNLEDGVWDEGTNVAKLVEQMKWLKMELSRALEESRAATLRADELETAFMELVKKDDRRLLSAKLETLEGEVARLRQALADKEEQEQAMVQVMLRMEHEQRLAEDARQYAEENAATQRHAASVSQAKYEGAIISLKEMEKRTVMAESMLEATLQCQSFDNSKRGIDPALVGEEESSRWSWPWKSPKPTDSEGGSMGLFAPAKLNGGDLTKTIDAPLTDPPKKQGLLSRRFSLAWREKFKESVGVPDLRTLSFASGQTSDLHSGFSSLAVSPQGSLDSSQISALYKNQSTGNMDFPNVSDSSDRSEMEADSKRALTTD